MKSLRQKIKKIIAEDMWLTKPGMTFDQATDIICTLIETDLPKKRIFPKNKSIMNIQYILGWNACREMMRFTLTAVHKKLK